jgi:aminoglycoside 2''-phosphotransferase
VSFIEAIKRVYPELIISEAVLTDWSGQNSDGLLGARGMSNSFRRYLYPHMRADARTATTAHFEHFFNTLLLHHYEPTWRHGDFGGENLLFDGEDVTGIIDFSFTGVGDPALDSAAISTYGDRFFAKLRQCYPEAETMVERAQFYRSMFALEEALHGILHHDPIAFESGIAAYR